MRHSIIVARIAVREDVPSPSNKEGADIAALPALCATKIELHRSIRKEGVGKAELARRLAVALL